MDRKGVAANTGSGTTTRYYNYQPEEEQMVQEERKRLGILENKTAFGRTEYPVVIIKKRKAVLWIE